MNKWLFPNVWNVGYSLTLLQKCPSSSVFQKLTDPKKTDSNVYYWESLITSCTNPQHSFSSRSSWLLCNSLCFLPCPNSFFFEQHTDFYNYLWLHCAGVKNVYCWGLLYDLFYKHQKVEVGDILVFPLCLWCWDSEFKWLVRDQIADGWGASVAYSALYQDTQLGLHLSQTHLLSPLSSLESYVDVINHRLGRHPEHIC